MVLMFNTDSYTLKNRSILFCSATGSNTAASSEVFCPQTCTHRYQNRVVAEAWAQVPMATLSSLQVHEVHEWLVLLQTSSRLFLKDCEFPKSGLWNHLMYPCEETVFSNLFGTPVGHQFCYVHTSHHPPVLTETLGLRHEASRRTRIQGHDSF